MTTPSPEPATALHDLLAASAAERVPVIVHFAGGQLRGLVARLDADSVELREGGTRSVVRLSQLIAVSTL